MRYKERIISDHKIMLGKPTVKGTRITVESILKKMVEGATMNDILSIYPNLSKEDVNAALEYACEVMESEEVIDRIPLSGNLYRILTEDKELLKRLAQ